VAESFSMMLRQLLVNMVDDATFAILDMLSVLIVFAVNDPLDSILSIGLSLEVVANFDLFVWASSPRGVSVQTNNFDR